MKYILLLSLLISTLYAAELPLPRSKRECPFAHILFKARMRTCTHADYHPYSGATPNPERQLVCVENFYASFITECQMEAKIIDKHVK